MTATSSPCEQCIVNPICREGCDKFKLYLKKEVRKFKRAEVHVSSRWLQMMSTQIRKYPETRQPITLAFGIMDKSVHCTLRTKGHGSIEIKEIKGDRGGYENPDGN